jgi:hypothetical protein
MTREENMDQVRKYMKTVKTLKSIGVKDVSSNCQVKNGTQVWRLPFKDAYDYDIEFATYSSGYVRKLVKYGYCPCYQINKREKIDGGFMKITTGPHVGLYRKRYDHSKCVLIKGHGDRIEYLFKFILRNYFVAKPKFQPQLNMDTLNRVAKYVFDERNFDLCDKHTQNEIIRRCQE